MELNDFGGIWERCSDVPILFDATFPVYVGLSENRPHQTRHDLSWCFTLE